MTTVSATRHELSGQLPESVAQTLPADARHRQWPWLAGGLVLAFALPFLLTDLLSVPRDVYYGVFAASVFGLAGAWLRFATESPGRVLARNWRSGLVLGVGFIGAMLLVVLNEPATSHPHGLDFAAAIAWRGLVYGFADGVLLSAFPIVAVFTAFAGKRVLDRRRGKAAVGALALGVSLLFTAVYHLGYSDFRGEKLRKPLVGDLIWSVPTLATLSPIASPITHAGLHVGAVVHATRPTRSCLRTPRPSTPQRCRMFSTSSSRATDRLAPGATAYVSGPAGSWSGAAGIRRRDDAATDDTRRAHAARERLEGLDRSRHPAPRRRGESFVSTIRSPAGCRASCPMATGSPSASS